VKQIRILLADGQTLVRSGIRALLERVPEVQIVREANDGHKALQLIGLHQPDVALINVALPKLNGLEVTRRVAKDFPKVRAIIFSAHANGESVRQALHSGAAGYLLKSADASELESAIKAVARGETYLSPALSKLAVMDYGQRSGENRTSIEQLTPRQREVLQLIVEGSTTKAIAQILKISVKTVETHRAQLMSRLGIYDVAGLVRYAIRAGIINLDE
jgi:DNA-binding NarL/FixJ family response regulator